MSTGNDTAFPVDYAQTPNNTYQLGLTKRELFAGMAMQSIAAVWDGHIRDMAARAVLIADALLMELGE
jgi:hypothetical protein